MAVIGGKRNLTLKRVVRGEQSALRVARIFIEVPKALKEEKKKLNNFPLGQVFPGQFFP